ncbi:MAG: PAS domain S-box protein [Anaerolineae bacterium]|jgi:PAS domain S-box-containing protein
MNGPDGEIKHQRRRADESWHTDDESRPDRETSHPTYEMLEKTLERVLQQNRVLEAERQHYRDLFEGTPQAYVVTDVSGTILEVNRATERLLEARRDRLIGRSLLDLVVERDRETIQGILTRLSGTGQAQEWRLQLESLEGTSFPAAILATTACDAQDQTSFRWLIQNINERLEEEEEEGLREIDDTFFSVLQKAPYGVLLIDRDERCLYANQEFTKITGYSQQEIPTVSDWLQQAYPGPDYRREVIECWIGDSAQRASRVFEIVCTDGKIKEVEFRPTLLDDGRAILVLSDVTVRKRIEKQLRKHTRELAMLNQASRVLASTLELDRVLATVLEEIRNLLGAVAASVWLIDRQTGELVCRQATGNQNDVVRGWRLAPGQGLAGQVIVSGRSLIVEDTQASNQYFEGVDDKTGLSLRSVLTVPLWTKDDVIGVLQVVDTAVGRFDSSDLALLEPLASTAAIAIENARLYKQAQRDAETKSVLLREVNHRVKNTLSSIVGLLYAEKRHASEEERAIYQPILTDLINRVQGLATVHRLLSQSEWKPLLLSELISEIIQSTLQTLPRDKHISVDVAQSKVRVTPEQARNLALVINELTTNTIKHALQDRNHARIAVRIALDDPVITLKFRDDGPGYPAEVVRLERYDVGFNLIQKLVCGSMKGDLSLRSENGAVALIQFRAEVDRPRGMV